MNCKLIKPTKEYEIEWMEYAKEYVLNNPNLLPLEYKFDISYDEWLKLLENKIPFENNFMCRYWIEL